MAFHIWFSDACKAVVAQDASGGIYDGNTGGQTKHPNCNEYMEMAKLDGRIAIAFGNKWYEIPAPPPGKQFRLKFNKVREVKQIRYWTGSGWDTINGTEPPDAAPPADKRCQYYMCEHAQNFEIDTLAATYRCAWVLVGTRWYCIPH